MSPLTADTFVPRGGTPLYDAMGHTIADARIRADARESLGDPVEEVMFVTFTDGHENQSQEYDRSKIFELVERYESGGWTLVYLGANQDSYGQGRGIGVKAGNTQNFAADGTGSRAAMSSLSSSVAARREKMRRKEAYDKADLFEGNKAAERDLRGRGRSV